MAGQITILPPSNAFDSLADPALYQGVTLKRVLAYAVDVVLVAAIAGAVWAATGILGLLSFGLLLPLQALAVAVVPLLYHVGLIASPAAATLGMRLFGLRVVSIADGGRPTPLQAAIQIVAFYGSVALTASFVLIVALFNPRRRTLHDMLAGTVVINDEKRL